MKLCLFIKIGKHADKDFNRFNMVLSNVQNCWLDYKLCHTIQIEDHYKHQKVCECKQGPQDKNKKSLEATIFCIKII